MDSKEIGSMFGCLLLSIVSIVSIIMVFRIIHERSDKIDCYETYIKDNVIITKCKNFFDEIKEKES